MIQDLVKNLKSENQELQMHCASAIFKVGLIIVGGNWKFTVNIDSDIFSSAFTHNLSDTISLFSFFFILSLPPPSLALSLSLLLRWNDDCACGRPWLPQYLIINHGSWWSTIKYCGDDYREVVCDHGRTISHSLPLFLSSSLPLSLSLSLYIYIYIYLIKTITL